MAISITLSIPPLLSYTHDPFRRLDVAYSHVPSQKFANKVGDIRKKAQLEMLESFLDIFS